jgi:sugar phosphate isomerase/epimerase
MQSPKRQPLGLVIHSYAVRGSKPLAPDYPPIRDPLAFAEHAVKIGAAGIQTAIGIRDAEYIKKLRESIERSGLYLEGIVSLPKDEADTTRFKQELDTANHAGVKVVRTVCLSGRRYETFRSAEQFAEFADRSWRSLQLAEPIARELKMQLAVENHKDWRIDEMLGWLKRLDSEFVGVCLDTGNSIALLEEPHEVVEAYAPWTMTTHLKDMDVAEYSAGFLLSEVPLGTGFLDLPRIVDTLRKTRPGVRLNLEMITRDPLRVPCLTDDYWATLPTLRAEELATTLEYVKRGSFPSDLPRVSHLDHVDQLEIESENVAKSLEYAQRQLS